MQKIKSELAGLLIELCSASIFIALFYFITMLR